MTRLDELGAAFLEAHPAEAARELDLQPPAPLARVLHDTPARVVAPVLAEMQPQAAAALIQCLDDERARSLVGRLSAARATAILRQLPPPQQDDLLGALPGAMALACRALLRYPVDSVGARMDTTIPLVLEHATVGEALETLRSATRECEGVVVIDAERRLRGWASAATLLRADPPLQLRAVSATMASVAALTPVGAALQAIGRNSGQVVAVIDTARRPVGTVTSTTLDVADRERGTDETEPAGPALGVVAAQYWRAVRGLTDIAVGVIVPLEAPDP